MKIGELAAAAGVSPSAIRYYEAAGIISHPARRNGVRHYEMDALDELRIVRFYRASGIPIRRLALIAKQQRGTSERRDVWIEVLKARITDLDSWMEEAQQTRSMLERVVACRCDGRRDACVVLQVADATPSRPLHGVSRLIAPQ